jgi:pimeloyl-ACP methyl ester carboxylesterase
VTRLDAALAKQRRGDAVELFLRVAGTPDDKIAAIRSSPYWEGMQALAHTLAYDAACLGDGRPPAGRLASITQPTLVATGTGHPPGSPAWVQALDAAADEIAARIPHADRRRLDGQAHIVDAEAFAPILAGFFTA